MNQLFDNHGRPLDYLRLSVTDRCNLRCFYCMPAEGIRYLPRHELLSYEELFRVVSLLASMGISKVRITGGEPFVRKGLAGFLQQLSGIDKLDVISLTTNGILTSAYLPALKEAGVQNINLSLDTLDRDRFYRITRRDDFDKVWKTLELLLSQDFNIKINMVVMEGLNEQDIIPLAELTRNSSAVVRFIEEMPFNGGAAAKRGLTWDHVRIVERLKAYYGAQLEKIPDAPHSTAYHYAVKNYKGSMGVIAAFSRTFCGSCNRIRLTARGVLKTCLYDNGKLNVKALLRSGISDEDLKAEFQRAFQSRPRDGFEAEGQGVQGAPRSSMATIGG